MKFKILMLILGTTFFSFAKEINLVLSYNTYYSPQGYTYFEVYYLLDPTSLKLNKEDGMFKGGVEITVTFSQNGEIINYDKLLIPINCNQEEKNNPVLQQSRLRLDTGNYDFKVSVKDVNEEMEPINYKQNLRVQFDYSSIHFSTPLFLNGYEETKELNEFSRGGYDIYPYITFGTPYFHQGFSKLSFYTELYSNNLMKDDEPFIIQYYIKDENNGKAISKYSGFKKKTASSVVPILTSFNIDKLNSGNYSLIIKAVNSKNEIIAKDSTFFYRFNFEDEAKKFEDLSSIELNDTWVEKINNKDTLYRYIDCLYPIASTIERVYADRQLESGDVETMKRFFLSFWQNKVPEKPREAWLDYYKTVVQIDKKYRTPVVPGYRTGRGRVFLQYGPPYLIESSIVEPRTYPYEIWQYDQAISASTTYQVNKIFVFVNYLLGGNDFELAHSDVIGEIYDPSWKLRIQKRDYNSGNIDDQNSSWGVDRAGSRYDNNIILGGAGSGRSNFSSGGGR